MRGVTPGRSPGLEAARYRAIKKKTEAARPWERKRSDRLTAVEGRRSNRGRRVTNAALPAHKLKPRPTSVSWLLRHGLERGSCRVVTEKKRKATAKGAKEDWEQNLKPPMNAS